MKLKEITRIASNISLVSSVALVVACEETSDTNLNGQYYMCIGTYTKTDQNGNDLTPAGSNNLVQDAYCGKNTAPDAPKQNSACTCATSINEAIENCQEQLSKGQSTQDPANSAITWNYTYSVTNSQLALQRLSDRCDPGGNISSVTYALVGGPAQYSADLTGNLGLSVTVEIDYVVYTDYVTYSDSSSISGRVDYSVQGTLGSCPAGGCDFTMTRFMGTAGNLQLSDQSITGINFTNSGSITGKVQNDGSIQIPASAFAVTLNFDRNGNHNSRNWVNGNVVSGQLSNNGTLLTLGQITINDGGTLTLSGLTATSDVAKPNVVINPPATTVECASPEGTSVRFDGTATTGGKGEYFWKVDDGTYTLTTDGQYEAVFGLGSHELTLAVPNSLEGVGYDIATVNVVDTTAPTLTPSDVTTVRVCDVANTGVTLTPPTVADGCTGVKELTGRVVSSNGQSLATPIVLTNGSGPVPVGVNQVVWEVVDNAGNTRSIPQSISVVPAFYASTGAYLPDGARLRSMFSDRVPLANGVSGEVQLGVEATSGEIWSAGTVWLRDRARVLGKVTAAGAIRQQSGVITEGLIPNASPFYLAPAPQLTAPRPTGGAPVSLEPGQTRTISPGSYGDLNVKSRATLSLSAGTYNFMSAMLEPDAVLRVSGNVTLVIANSFTYRASVSYVGQGRLTIIYLGTNTTFIERRLARADIYSPNAKVVLGAAGINSYVGSITALQIEAAPRATIMCDR